MVAETLATGAWRVMDEATAASPEDGVGADFALLDAVAEGRAPDSLRLWQNRQCLVVSARDAKLPNFAEACGAMEASGWPVVVRRSGGTAVPHGGGVLLVSMAFEAGARTQTSIDDGYRRLCDVMIAALARMRIHATCRDVPAAFCDGRYNLAIGPQKIAGTAQRWRRRAVDGVTRQGVLAHALLLVDGDAGEMTAAVNRFYHLAGAAQRFDCEAVTTVARCLGHPPDVMEQVRRAIIDAAGAAQPVPAA